MDREEAKRRMEGFCDIAGDYAEHVETFCLLYWDPVERRKFLEVLEEDLGKMYIYVKTWRKTDQT